MTLLRVGYKCQKVLVFKLLMFIAPIASFVSLVAVVHRQCCTDGWELGMEYDKERDDTRLYCNKR